MKKDALKHYADVTHYIHSQHLEDLRTCYVWLPPSYTTAAHRQYHVLYINDGQDMEQLRIKEVLQGLYAKKAIEELIVVAVPAVHRLQEYGTASMPDYAHRGSKAAHYTKFVVNELMPLINASYRTSKSVADTAIIGFSLGGLTALDIAWNNPFQFGKTGVFSGSFWWRKKGLDENYHDEDRIMHHIIRNSAKKEGLKFWMQAGTEDEKEDRNNNGIIDAIDDTLDVMKELATKGYQQDIDYTYVEVEGGQHNFDTWSYILPDFLTWAYGVKVDAENV